MKTEKRFFWKCLLLFIPFLAWDAFTADEPEMKNLEQSQLLLVASDVEIRDSDRGLKVARFFGVDKPVDSVDLTKPKNMVAVYSDDPGFRRYIGYHFDEMANDQDFTGDTWYSSRPLGGFKLLLIMYDSEGTCGRVEANVDAVSIMIWDKGE